MMALTKVETNKSVDDVIETLKMNVKDFGFMVRNIFNIADEFESYGVNTDKNFKYYSIMICNPSKAYSTIQKNPLRGAVLFPPKQIVIFEENGKTIISYMKLNPEQIKCSLPDDLQFQENLDKTGDKIIELIKSLK